MSNWVREEDTINLNRLTNSYDYPNFISTKSFFVWTFVLFFDYVNLIILSVILSGFIQSKQGSEVKNENRLKPRSCA